jgi:16S rRNA (guanine527-N7)-methyltransferase
VNAGSAPWSLDNVSRETLADLQAYMQLLEKWNKAINLVAKSTIDDAWNRHILDSAQLFPHAAAGNTWADIGSGGGFPGMVIAILAKSWRPDLRVTLIEADQRKAVFLREVARATNTPVKLLSQRIETVPPLGADTLSARAFAPLDVMMPYVAQHMATDGVALLPKGSHYPQEVANARKSWNFDCQIMPSQTNAEAVILKIQGVRRV